MNRSAVLALGGLVVLGGVFFATRQERVSVGVQSLTMSQFERQGINQIDITGKGSAKLSQNGDQWQVELATGQKKVTADAAKVNELLKAVEDLRSAFMITDRVEKHADYEVTEEKASAVTLKGDDGSVTLFVGKRTAKGANYVRLGDDDRVFSAKTPLASLLGKQTADWRGRSLWSLSRKEMTRVHLKQADGNAFALVLSVEGPSGTVALAEDVKTPQGFRFGEVEAKRIVDALPRLMAADFVDEATAGDITGLEGPHNQVVIEKQQGQSFTLHLGKTNDKKQVFARVDGQEQILLIHEGNVRNLVRGLEAVRAMDLIAFEEDKVAALEILANKKLTKLVLQDGQWAVKAPQKLPDGFEFDPATVGRQLRSLKNTRAEAYQGRQATAETGLARPSTKVTVTTVNGESLALVFGAEVEDAGAKAYVKSPIDGAVYLVRAFQKNRFDKGIELFKKVAPPPMNFNQAQGFNSLPPDVRKSLEEQMRKQNL